MDNLHHLLISSATGLESRNLSLPTEHFLDLFSSIGEVASLVLSTSV